MCCSSLGAHTWIPYSRCGLTIDLYRHKKLSSSRYILYSSNICEILLYNRQLDVITHELIYGVRAAYRQGKKCCETSQLCKFMWDKVCYFSIYLLSNASSRMSNKTWYGRVCTPGMLTHPFLIPTPTYMTTPVHPYMSDWPLQNRMVGKTRQRNMNPRSGNRGPYPGPASSNELNWTELSGLNSCTDPSYRSIYLSILGPRCAAVVSSVSKFVSKAIARG